MDMVALPRSILRGKVNACLDRYLALSGKQSMSLGLYIKGRQYIIDLNGSEADLFYDIGSVSKTVTAHLILKLFSEHGASLHAPVSEYLPLKDGSYPTVYALLTHTAGYRHLTPAEITLPMLLRHRYSFRNPYESTRPADVLRALERRNRHKGACHYGYSDFSYAILAMVAEGVGQKPFATLLQDFLTNDLALPSTTLTRTQPLPQAVHKGKPIPYWHWDKENPYLAAGGVVSNVFDMLSYVKTQIESQAPYITGAHEICQDSFRQEGNTGTCIGWHTYKKSNQLWHVGGVGTFRSSVIFNRTRGLGVVALGNTKGKSTANIHYIAKMLYSELKMNKIKPKG